MPPMMPSPWTSAIVGFEMSRQRIVFLKNRSDRRRSSSLSPSTVLLLVRHLLRVAEIVAGRMLAGAARMVTRRRPRPCVAR